MKTYIIRLVNIINNVVYVVPVCANSQEEAEQKALDLPYNNGDYLLARSK